VELSRAKSRIIGFAVSLAVLLNACTSSRPIYDAHGRLVGHREEFDPGKTLMVLGFGLSGLASSGIAKNAAAAADAYRYGQALSAVGRIVSTERGRPLSPSAVQAWPTAQRPAPAHGASQQSRALAANQAPVSIMVSSAIGIEPLHIGFSAACPPSWRNTADFSWSLNGENIATGANSQATLTVPREYLLALVVQHNGTEHHAQRTIRVLPRLSVKGR